MAPVLHVRLVVGLAITGVILAAVPGAGCRRPPLQRPSSIATDAFPPADKIALEHTRQALGDRFCTYDADRFSIMTDVRTEQVGSFRLAAEETYASIELVASRLVIPVQRPRFKLLLIVFDQWEAYESWARRAGLNPDLTTPGFFDEQNNCCVLFNYANHPLISRKREELTKARTLAPDQVRRMKARLASLESVINETVVRHDIAHEVLLNLGVIQPGESRLWLKEGLAMQFEGGSPFSLSHRRLADFFTDKTNATPAYIRSLIADERRLRPGADRLPEAYAAAGVLVQFLIERQPAALGRFLQKPPATTTRPSNESTEIVEFEAALGPLDQSFEVEFRRFVDNLRISLDRSGGVDDDDR